MTELKSKLELKLSEINGLVEELGSLPEKAVRRSIVKQRRSVSIRDLSTSPNARDWRNIQSIGGVLSTERDGQDGRLPSILEDKYYPRRTLETEELQALRAAANIEQEDTESPDLGPPPVAHFEDADPITFDSTRSPKRVSGGIIIGEDEIASLPKNLETRRKRRTSSLLQDMSSLHSNEEVVEENKGSEHSELVKPNVKRKFEITELEVSNPIAPHNDDFEFSRRESSVVNRPKPSRFAPKSSSREQTKPIGTQLVSPEKAINPRAALASKSTNSPTKRSTMDSHDKKDSLQNKESADIEPTIKRATITNPRRVARIIIPPTDDVDNSAHPPKTPGLVPDDILSPPSSALDTAPKVQTREAATMNSVEDVLNGSIGRGSRRAKSAVSYAEPNLRDKMRRPDKKLVGAVEGLGRPSLTSSEREKEGGVEQSHGSSSMRVVKIKAEKPSDEEVKWKDIPDVGTDTKGEAASPLHDKSRSSIPRSSEVRKKRTFSESEGTKPKSSAILHVTDEDLDKAVSRLSIFDPPNSSPASIKTEDRDASTQPHLSGEDASTITIRPSNSRSSSTSTTTAVTAPKSRRYSVQPSANTSIAISGKENVSLATSKLKRANSVQVLSQPSAQSQAKAPSIPPERTLGSRRRSMMV